jgi:hypothetical protein
MILSRLVFQAKIGKAADVVAHFKSIMESATDEQWAALQPRILTDISGRFDTVVVETTHESLATFEQFRSAMINQQGNGSGPGPGEDVIESGRRELYTIEL